MYISSLIVMSYSSYYIIIFCSNNSVAQRETVAIRHTEFQAAPHSLLGELELVEQEAGCKKTAHLSVKTCSKPVCPPYLKILVPLLLHVANGSSLSFMHDARFMLECQKFWE
ncbi:Hypothetical predicted protein [Podarcis lilfordi]|uniref:Uncharacterized protein n=1 Tax=Podarcis lilfordi TaxID=74358 RepID=A0AA35K146_9SAUR|nr:Hypothetical predicted protein [Podarcis lilfordi]